MSDDPQADSMSLLSSDENDTWVSGLFKLTGAGGGTIAAPANTNSSSAAPSAPAADTCTTPDATPTDCFFDFESSTLTDSDKTMLEAYAKAYLAAKPSAPITLEGYASIEGDKGKNVSLSRDRAAQVAKYLISQKVPKARVTFEGKGPTDHFSPDDLCQNRRVTIKPELKLTVRDFVDVVETEPRNVPVPGKEPNVSLGEKADEGDIPEPPEPPPEMVSRDEVEAALKQWLLDLGKSQKVKTRDSVHSTSRVHVAEETLLGDRLGESVGRLPVTPDNGDGRGHDAAELAHQIAENLPDEIPKENFDNFKKLKPVEGPVEKSTADEIRDKLDEKADQVLKDFHVPKKYWKNVKDYVRKHMPDLIDDAPVNQKFRDGIKQAYDKLNKSGDDQ